MTFLADNKQIHVHLTTWLDFLTAIKKWNPKVHLWMKWVNSSNNPKPFNVFCFCIYTLINTVKDKPEIGRERKCEEAKTFQTNCKMQTTETTKNNYYYYYYNVMWQCKIVETTLNGVARLNKTFCPTFHSYDSMNLFTWLKPVKLPSFSNIQHDNNNDKWP